MKKSNKILYFIMTKVMTITLLASYIEVPSYAAEESVLESVEETVMTENQIESDNTETVTETITQAPTSSETITEPETTNKTTTETSTDSDTKSEPETITEPTIETSTQVESETIIDPETVIETITEPTIETSTQTETIIEPETTTEPTIESTTEETETETEIETESETTVSTELETDTEEYINEYGYIETYAANDTTSNAYPVMEFEGTYYTETAEKILKRLNAIRYEACKEGVKNPNTGKPLTLADYNELKWSSDLEEIARIRAAEATLYRAHTRPNGESCFSVISSKGESSWAENLAWNYDGIMYGINQWYDEKSAWVNNTDAVTGHYTSIINPYYNYVAIGAFKLSSGWYTVAQEFSYNSSMDDTKDTSSGKTKQIIEISQDKVTSLKLNKTSDVYLVKGETYTSTAKVSVSYDVKYTGKLVENGTWASSDESVAVVDDTGTVTARGAGTAEISLSLGNKKVSYKVKVYDTNIGNGDENLNTGYNLNYTDQFVINTKKASKPFKSLTGPKTMKSGTDYTVKLKAKEAFDASGKSIVKGTEMKDVSIPAGYSGTFTLEITGQGNYSGSVVKTVYVADKTHIMKNAKITLGKNIKKVSYKSEGITLTASSKNSPDTFTVKLGKEILDPKDYEVTYRNNDRVGKAELVIIGKGDYIGTKTITFQITGKTFNAKKVTITGIKDKDYTGNVVTQDNIKLQYEGNKTLQEGKDYTVTYTKNINKGTATITFKGMETAGYTGTVKKTFKIK